MLENYLPILILSTVAIGLGAMFLFLSHYIGPQKKSKQKFEPYECGVDPIEEGRKKFHVKFFLIATFFIIFDVETIFLVPWAIAFKNMENVAIVGMVIFLLILTIGLIYILKKKVFEWD